MCVKVLFQLGTVIETLLRVLSAVILRGGLIYIRMRATERESAPRLGSRSWKFPSWYLRESHNVD